MQQSWPVSFALFLTIATSLLLFAGPATSGNNSPKDQIGPHGALDMEAQKAIAAKLIPKRDVSQPPTPIDPEIWDTVVVPPTPHDAGARGAR